MWLVAILGAIGLLLYLFVFDTWEIPLGDPLAQAAMQPTLGAEDRILTRRGSMPKSGELARCRVPDGTGKFVIGRVFGHEGDTVDIENERVLVNKKSTTHRSACGLVSVVHPVSGDALALSCSTEGDGSSTYNVLAHPEFREGPRTAKVEPTKFFLVSDNRHIHWDSRDFGQVDAASCEPVVFRLWGASYGDASRRFNILW